MKQMIPVLLVLLSLCLTPALLAETIAVLPEVMNPNTLDIYDGQIFVTDKNVIHIYNLKDFKLLKTFGKQGEGPGEFKSLPYLKPYPTFLEINSQGKVMYFSRKGEYIRETKLDSSIRWVSSVGDAFLARKWHFDRKTRTGITGFVILDKEFKLIKELGASEDIQSFGADGKINMRIMFPQLQATVFQDNIYLTDANKGFYIAVYNTKGELVKEIKRDYKKQIITEKFKTAFINRLKKASKHFETNRGRFNIEFAEYFPAINFIQVYPGVIFLPLSTDPSGNAQVTLLDLDGKFIKTGTKRTDVPNTFHKGRMYYLIENEDKEQWELIAEDL